MQTVVSRFTYSQSANTIATSSEKVLLTLQHIYGNHKGGQIAFGPDGYLYIAIGDGGSANDPHNNGQNKQVWFGKLLRIDVDRGDPYQIPATNPFANDPDTKVKREIWAFGLRNPWRFGFDRQTGDLYIADVGQGVYEEIDFQAAASKGGENYGWRCREGLHDFNMTACKDASQYAPPVIEYSHEDGRCSVTGGAVYRGALEPALQGKYFYADYCSGEIFYTQQSTTWTTTVAATTQHRISTFGEDTAGEIYYTDLPAGTLYRVTDTAN
jgi:glucose/arabinose dehydrogenase